MKKSTVTFETKCYEKDWEFLLKTPLLKMMIDNCNYKFNKKVLIINNVKDRKIVELHAKKAKDNHIIDNYYFVEDYEKKVLNHFKLKKDDFKGGYLYSISELVSLYLCKTDFLLHFSGDTLIFDSSSDWISRSMDYMKKDKSIFVANPCWTKNKLALRVEAEKEDKFFYFGKGFSDQCYLVRSKDFRKNIYMEKNPVSDVKYPIHGGDLFEKKVNAYIRNHNLYRITAKGIYAKHKNFPKNGFTRKVEFSLIKQFSKRFLSDYLSNIRKIVKNRPYRINKYITK